MQPSQYKASVVSTILVIVVSSFLTSTAIADCDLGCDWQKVIKLVQPLSPAKLQPVVMEGFFLLLFAAGHPRPIREGDPVSLPRNPDDPPPDTSQSGTPGTQSSSTSNDWLDDLLARPWTPYTDPYLGKDTIGPRTGPCTGHLCGDVEELGVPDAGTPEDREGLRNKQRELLDSDAARRDFQNRMLYEGMFGEWE